MSDVKKKSKFNQNIIILYIYYFRPKTVLHDIVIKFESLNDLVISHSHNTLFKMHIQDIHFSLIHSVPIFKRRIILRYGLNINIYINFHEIRLTVYSILYYYVPC